jgi:hypothetical protein
MSGRFEAEVKLGEGTYFICGERNPRVGIGNADSIVDSGEWGSSRSAERKRFADSALDAPTRAAPDTTLQCS